MYQLIYETFFYVLLGQVLFFLFLALPTPHGIKGKVVNFMNKSTIIQQIRKIHFGLCLIAFLFLIDSFNTEAKYASEKAIAKAGDSIASGTRHLYLSYMTLKTQRNSYITGMLIYVSLALNIYVWLLNYMYQKRQKYDLENPKAVKVQKADK